jgi:hypothetical protein
MAVRMCRKNAWSRTGRYFKRCEEKGERLTLSGLAMALGCSLAELKSADFEPEETRRVIKRALRRLAYEQEMYLLEKGSARDWLAMGTYLKGEEKEDGGGGERVYVVMSEEARRFGR